MKVFSRRTSREEIAALETLLQSRGRALETVEARSDGTVGGAAPTLLGEQHAFTAASLVSDERLDVHGVLGRGGMGLVRRATQRSLRREVAVKTVLDVESVPAQVALLKEAWAAGALEHPSVVPVHTLTRLEGGAAVVMKRVEGTNWLQVAQHPEAHPRFSRAAVGVEAALEAHVRVLVRVCHAMAFAHERGILHLDLKPENVMIGDLGEVYVLDWGLATGTAEGPDWLGRAGGMTLPAGTPAYMAPEVAAADAERIGVRTDVYLLGAMLHHVITGGAPHDAETLIAALTRAYLDEAPEYDAEIPRELAAIQRRALARDPDARFPSVDAMREALEAFLRHRDAEHYRARAEERLLQVDARAEEGAGGDAELEALLSECEVALEQVRREWAEHPRLPQLDHALLVRRARHAIAQKRLETARALLSRMTTAEPELEAAVGVLARELDSRDQHVRALESMAREVDLTLGSSERRRVFMVLGALWTLLSLGLDVLDHARLFALDYRGLLIEGGILVALLAPYGWAHRTTYFVNRANRRLYGGLIVTGLVVELFWIAARQLDVPVRSAVAITPVFYAYAFATMGLALDRRLVAGSGTFLLSAALAALFPEWAFALVGLGGGLTIATVLFAGRATAT